MIVVIWLDVKAISYGSYYRFGYYGSGFLILNPNTYRANALLIQSDETVVSAQTKPYY